MASFYDEKAIVLETLLDNSEEIQMTNLIQSISKNQQDFNDDFDDLSSQLIALTTIVTSGRNEHEKLKGLCHETFDFVLNEVFPVNERFTGRKCQQPLQENICLLITLWYLGHQCTFKDISQQFGLSESCVHRNIEETIDKIASLGDKFVKWPTLEELPAVEKKFFELNGFPNVISAIDGCHVRFKAPASHQKDYLDRTMNHSINLMATCDADKVFTFAYAGFPGSAHDQRVFENCMLGRKCENDPYSLLHSNKYHMIGDSAFALKNYMMVPFKDNGNLTADQLVYNAKLSKTRRVIENSFAWLKGRFRRLKFLDMDLCRVSKTVIAAVMLHNISLNYNEEREMLENFCSDDSEGQNGSNNEEFRSDVNAKQKRDELVNLLTHL